MGRLKMWRYNVTGYPDLCGCFGIGYRVLVIGNGSMTGISLGKPGKSAHGHIKNMGIPQISRVILSLYRRAAD